MRKLYQTYIASHFIVPFVASALFFVIFLLSFELFRITELLAQKDVTLWFVLGLVKDIALAFIPLAIPLSLFFSTMFAVSRLCSDSEYIALRSCGVQKHQILVPYLIVAVLTALMVFFLSQEIVPKANKGFRTKIEYLSSSGITSGLKSGQFFTKIKNVTLFPEYVSEDGKEIKKIFIQIHDPALNKDRVIFADTGELKVTENTQTEVESLALILKNGNIVDTVWDKDNIEKILFEVYDFPLSEQKFVARIRTKETMMTRKELSKFIQNGKMAALEAGYKAQDYFNAIFEFWNRINTPILCLVFTFAGFSLGIKGNRGQGRNNALKAIFIMVLYYTLFFSAIGFARDGKMPLHLALIIPLAAFFTYIFREYKSLDWQA